MKHLGRSAPRTRRRESAVGKGSQRQRVERKGRNGVGSRTAATRPHPAVEASPADYQKLTLRYGRRSIQLEESIGGESSVKLGQPAFGIDRPSGWHIN